MLKRISSVFLLTILALGSVAPVLAQETTGSIEGTVMDASGARVAGATVKAEGGSFVRTITAGDDGFFRMAQVPPGTYRITVNAGGFAPWTADNVVVLVGKSLTVEVSLKPGGVQEQVNVTGSDVVSLDPTDNKVQTNITSRVIEALPKGTNFTSLLKVSPATRGEGLAGGFQVDGASGSENSFIIDGQEVSNFRTGVLNFNNNLPFQFIQEVQVKTSGFEAEFGGATGGVINVVTKGGSNAWHGEFGLQFENDSLNADPNPFLSSFRSGSGSSFVQINQYLQPRSDNFTNLYPAATVSGPVVKDRVWFLASYSPQFFNTTRESNYFSSDPRTRTQTASEIYTLRDRQEYAFTRLDASITDALRVSGTYTWNPYIRQGNLPAGNIAIGGAPPSANLAGRTYTGHRLTDLQGGRQNASNVTASAVWTPNSKLVGTFRFSRGFLNEKLGGYAIPNETRYICSAGPIPAAAGCSIGFQNITSNSQVLYDVSFKTNFEGDVSYLLSNFGGRHEFKGGYQNAKVENDVKRGYKDLGIIRLYYSQKLEDALGLPSAPGSIGWGELIRFGTDGAASNRAQSIYIQDKWQPMKSLTISAGVRFEKEDLPSFNGFAPPIKFGWGDKIVPRLGVAYDLFGDGKTKLFASYGRFTDRLKFELPRGSFGGDFYRWDYFDIQAAHPEYTYYTLARVVGNFDDRIGGQCPVTGSTGLSRCQFDYRIASNTPAADIYTGLVDPKLKPFRQTEVTGGIEHQLSENYLVRARYTYKNVDSAIEDAGFPTPEGSEAYIIGNPGTGLHKQISDQFGYAKVAEPERRYDGFEVVVDRRLANNYFFNMAYTYSRLYGNYSGLASSDENGRTSPGVNRFFDLPFVGFTWTGAPDNGRLATDRPHVFNMYGGYNWNWWGNAKNSTLLSFFTTAQSGTPVTTYASFYNIIIPLYERGDLGRTPVYTQTDFSVSHKVKLSEGSSLAFEFNALNIFDERNVTFRQNNATGSGTGTASTLGLGAIDEPAAINVLLRNGLQQQGLAYLNDPANPQRRNTNLGLASGFQGPRSIRLGVKYTF